MLFILSKRVVLQHSETFVSTSQFQDLYKRVEGVSNAPSTAKRIQTVEFEERKPQ